VIVCDEEPRDRAVAEVEHEPRALVVVVEEVRLAARGDHQDRPKLRLAAEHVAGDAQRDRRAVVVTSSMRGDSGIGFCT